MRSYYIFMQGNLKPSCPQYRIPDIEKVLPGQKDFFLFIIYKGDLYLTGKGIPISTRNSLYFLDTVII